jgi:hypothetical protein
MAVATASGFPGRLHFRTAARSGAGLHGGPGINAASWERGIESRQSISRLYLDEMTWRFNNRKNPYLFRDTMLKLIHSDNLEYKELTATAA